MQNEAKKQSPSIELYGFPYNFYEETQKILEQHYPIQTVKDVQLNNLSEIHYAAWATLRASNPETLKKYEPEWDDNELSADVFIANINPNAIYPTWRYAIEVTVNDDIRMLAGVLTVSLPRGGTEKAIRIAYWIGEPFQDKGIGSRAIEKLISMVKATASYRRIEALVVPDNVRSIRILEKAGFEKEGMLRKVLKINGKWEDHNLYSFLIEDLDT